jgi:hypothetical protein
VTTKWEVEKAVLHSKLEPLARLLMLALLAKATVETAVVEPQHTPSLTTLCGMTGMGRSSVTEWLNALETAGWIKRTKPDEHTRDEKTQYTLLIGAPEAHRPTRASRVPKKLRSSAQGGLLVDRTADHKTSESSQSGRPHSAPPSEPSGAHSGPLVGRTADGSRPHSGRATTESSPTGNSHHQEPSTSAPSVPPADEPEPDADENTRTVLAAFIDYCRSQDVTIPKRLIGQYAKLIKEALDDKIQPIYVRKALWSMFRDKVINRPSLLPNRIVEAQTGPEQRNGARHVPHQNKPDANYEEGL